MKNVAVTGASGYLGQQLISRLERDDSVERIVGISRRAPKVASSKLKFYSHDIREPFDKIFVENKVDTAIHLAFVVSAARDVKAARVTDVEGSKNFLDACKNASVKRVSFLSSYTAYGAYPDSPQPIVEDLPLKPNAGFQYPHHKAEVDKMFQEFMKQNPNICVSVLRAVAVAGPASDGGPLASFLKNPVSVRIKGYDPLWQFVHEDDLTELTVLLLKNGHKGVFNVAGDGAILYSEMLAKIGKRCLTLPNKVSAFITNLTWYLHLQSESPGGKSSDILMYPIVLSTEKVKKETGFAFKYTGQEAFQLFLDAARSKAKN
jgi:UDP-glucose 4-epimerase